MIKPRLFLCVLVIKRNSVPKVTRKHRVHSSCFRSGPGSPAGTQSWEVFPRLLSREPCGEGLHSWSPAAVCDPVRLNDLELHRVQNAGVCLIKQTGGDPPRMPPPPPPRQGCFWPDCGSFLPSIVSIVLVC